MQIKRYDTFLSYISNIKPWRDVHFSQDYRY